MAGAGATEQRDEVSEFLKQNRQLAEWVEALRGECESEKHWAARRHFILRNLEGFDIKPPGGPFPNLNRLLSLSMVWANHVFLGCRYPQAVMEKVLELAEGIDVLDAPSRTTRDDLVVKMKKRGLSSSNEEAKETCRKKKSAFKEDNGCSKNVRNEICGEARANHTNLQWQSNMNIGHVRNPDHHHHHQGYVVDPLPSTSSNQTVAKLVATLSGQRTIMTSNEKAINSHLMPPFAGHELQKQNLIPAPLESRLCTNFFHHVKNGSLQNSQPSPQECASKGGETSIIPSYKLTPETVKDRQTFYNRLYKAVAWKLVSAGGFSPNLNHLGILNSCIESIKATLDSYFLPLKDISDLPYNKASSENIVCELRCKSVYLGTGCGKSEENAKVVASREALKLFLKKKVIVKIMKRKYKGRDIEDLVLLDEESKPLNLPPALRNPQEIYQDSQ
ncbi:CDKN2A-interacting protein isoform X2 [Latimeria chalumnae]|uniref:CDKN2A-interacting protein isoform X2 n=1 Tax=Latimeria chalumnae TaxID=7897 RepID=UPI0003C14DAF|nr:PREDICTED: CDKN2A-interacting protein isoform X1 [Latimeria chalumnae]|eukprot:XP_005989540.1 PREDICTED: CDKN2A-interacting protein isoform X1 [Latimeria chalumnae]